jgi:hypothetical protein
MASTTQKQSITLTYDQFIGVVTPQTFYKVLRGDMTSFGEYTYKLGRNDEKIIINSDGTQAPWNGFTFTTLSGVIDQLHYGNNIAVIELHKDAKFKIENSKYKTNYFDIKCIIPITDFLNNSCDLGFVKCILTKYPCYFYFLDQKTKPELCLYLVEQDGMNLRFIKNQTPELCIMAVQQNWKALQFVHEQNQNQMLCMIALRQCFEALQYVKNQTTDLCKYAIEQDLMALMYVHDVTSELYQMVEKKNFNILRYIKDKQPRQLCEFAVKRNGLLLEYVLDQDLELCVSAVMQNGRALKFVKKQFKTSYVCNSAIKENYLAAEYIEDMNILQCKSDSNTLNAIKYTVGSF